MKHGLLLALACLTATAAVALASQRTTTDGGPTGTGSGERSLSERYKAFALEETRDLALRTCRRVSRRALFEAFSDDDDPDDDNYIALGYVARTPLTPIPLQREAYDGCRRGLRAQRADSRR